MCQSRSLEKEKEEPIVQNDTLVAVDIAKEVFEIGVSDRPGRVASRRRLYRHEFLEFFAQLPQATVSPSPPLSTILFPRAMLPSGT